MPIYQHISSHCRGCFGLSFDSKLRRCPRLLSALEEQPDLAAIPLPNVRGQCPIGSREGTNPRLKLTSTLMARQVTATASSPRAGVADHLAEHRRPRQLALLVAHDCLGTTRRQVSFITCCCAQLPLRVRLLHSHQCTRRIP